MLKLRETILAMTAAVALFSASAAYAQSDVHRWEVGAVGGYGMSPSLTVQNATTSASTGFHNGIALGVFAGEDTYRYWSGEVNYLYRQSDLKLEGSGQSAGFSAHTHIITGDFLGHFAPVEARFRPFVSFGGGVKILSGTDLVSLSQPLRTLAAFNSGNEVLAVGAVGAGIKYRISKSVRLRFQVRDYISQAPSKVINPGPGAQMSGIVNDIVATGAVSFTW
jgi:hypothetical protein